MKTEDGKVIFDTEEQAKVDEIVRDRLARHKPDDYDDLKEIAETLTSFDYVGTPTEIKAALRAQADIFKANKAEEQRQAELETLRQEAKSEGTSPELLAEIKALKVEIAAIKQKETDAQKIIENQKAANANWQKQETEFTTKYPNVDLTKLDNDEKFIKFVKRSNPTLTLVEKYEDYVELVGGAESMAMEKFKLNSDRATNNGKAKGETGGGTYGLTSKQQSLADDADMTYKEYAEAMKLIKR